MSAQAFSRIVEKDPKTITNWIKRGWIKNVKRVGRNYHIPIEEVEVFNNADEYPPGRTP